MATKLAIGFFLKSTKEMSKDDMPHDGSETLFGLDEAGTASKLYRRHRLLAETRRDIRQMTKIQAIIFDKTGTLTEGKPSVTDVMVFGAENAVELDENKLLQVAATAETDSEHPLAGAIVEGAKARQLAVLPYNQFNAIAGGGVQAVVEARTVLVGTPKLLAQYNIQLQPSEQEQLAALQAQGKTVMVVALDSRAAGLIAVADRIRPTARETVTELQALDIRVAIQTGDNRRTAEAEEREGTSLQDGKGQ